MDKLEWTSKDGSIFALAALDASFLRTHQPIISVAVVEAWVFLLEDLVHKRTKKLFNLKSMHIDPCDEDD